MAPHWTLPIVIAVGQALSLSAADYAWTNARGDGDWANVQNYSVGGAAPSALPGAADTVTIPDNVTIRLEYDSSDEAKRRSCEVFGGVGRIVPEGDGAVIDVTVPADGKLEFSCAIAGSLSKPLGLLVKRGAGELDLMAVGKVGQSSGNYDYYTNVEALDGVLKFPQTVSTVDAYYGVVTVRSPGVLFTGNVCKSLEANRIARLYGDGVVTNDHSALCEMRVNGGSFAGVLSGMNSLTCGGALSLLGEESVLCADSVVLKYNYGHGADGVHSCLGIRKFGMKGTSVDGSSLEHPSSIGHAEKFDAKDNGGAILYLGSGETTDKDFRIWNPSEDCASVIDAGADGGLV